MTPMFDDEDPHDWEIRDEEPPERLQKKWEKEEAIAPRNIVCPSCKKEVSSQNLTCIFCGAVIPKESYLVNCFWKWLKRLFKKS